MAVPVKYGTKRILIGVHDPYPFQCPNCKELGTVSFALYGEYYHFWFIPVFPFDKDGIAKCSNCNLHIGSVKFNKLTKEEFSGIKTRYKHPFYTYTGLILIAAPFIIGMLAYFFS
jgi:hypothetical protein